MLPDDDLTVSGSECRFRVDAVLATGTLYIERPESPACRYQHRNSTRRAALPRRGIDARVAGKILVQSTMVGALSRKWDVGYRPLTCYDQHVLPKMIVTRLAFRKAVYVALILSFVGLLLVCLPLFGLQQTEKFATEFVPQIAVGYAAMVLMVEVVGIPFRSALTRFWVGGLFAFALFIAGVLAGSAASMVVYKDFDPVAYVLSPLFFLGIYGFFPALIIGFIGVSILRSNSRKTEE